MAIKWQISKYAYKLHGIWGRAVGICNDPEKSPILELLVIFFFGHCDIMHYHASITLHFYCQTQNYFEIKLFFLCLYVVIINPPFYLLILIETNKTKYFLTLNKSGFKNCFANLQNCFEIIN
jgi:hypothetical protein